MHTSPIVIGQPGWVCLFQPTSQFRESRVGLCVSWDFEAVTERDEYRVGHQIVHSFHRRVKCFRRSRFGIVRILDEVVSFLSRQIDFPRRTRFHIYIKQSRPVLHQLESLISVGC